MTSICQELSESDVKIVLVNNSTTPVFLSLLPCVQRDSKMFIDIFHTLLSSLELFDSNEKGFHGAHKASHC